MAKERAEGKLNESEWRVVERPGYLGKHRDATVAEWNVKYGEGNWKLGWQTANGEVWCFVKVFWGVYVAGYVKYFLEHPEEADFLACNYSYAYDKDMVTRSEAFDPYTLFERPGRINQFHNVALNLALELFLGRPFRGGKPIQVREGKHGVPESERPEGWRWGPGRISAVRRDLISSSLPGWWETGSIEDFYQSTKVLLVRQ